MNTPTLDAQRWKAVCDRDKTQDGLFFFAVLTTGIYCRPSCASRRARRENVRFFDTPTEAEKAGYRACKRCRPNEAADRSRHLQAIIQACDDIKSAEEEPDLAILAARAGLSREYFQRVFKARVGLSPKRYAVAIRKQRLRDKLTRAETVTNAIYEAGYASASRAYADKAVVSMTPNRYRKGAAGETIRYASAETSLGNVVMAATQQGVCLVEFAEPRDTMTLLKARFPRARLEAAGAGLDAWMTAVVSLIDGRRGAPDEGEEVPLDIRGTAFQEEVWRALAGIPPGKTVSYAELARSIGKPNAARAVAAACAANRLAAVIPCHRAIRRSGGLAGYRWGAGRKKALLEKENPNG